MNPYLPNGTTDRDIDIQAGVYDVDYEPDYDLYE